VCIKKGSKCVSKYLSQSGWATDALRADSAVGVATGYGLDGRKDGVRVSVGARFFSSSRCPERFGAHPASYPMGTGDSFPGGKAAGA
jgi:hypothetical protein